jgi:nitrate reductase NapAB chaperone NapD
LPAGVFIQKGSVERAKAEFLSSLPDVQWKIETIVDRDEITGAVKDIQRLTAQDSRIEITPRTELLDAKLRDIDSQFQKFNRTAGAGIQRGFQTAGAEAQQFAGLVDQVNLKLRATQAVAGMAAEEIDRALADREAIETQVKFNRAQADKEAKAFQDETKRLFERSQEQPELQIRVAPEAYARIGEIQAELQQLQNSGATNIEVTVDEKTGKLIVTADTSQADASVNEVIRRINASEAVLNVRVKYNDPGFTPRNTSVNVAKRRWGGPIAGYGGGDRVRALLEPGEFVLRKEAVKAIGLGKLLEMNRHRRIPRAPRVRDSIAVPRMATGGPVLGSPIVINLPGGQSVRGLSGSRDAAAQLAKLLVQTGRAL